MQAVVFADRRGDELGPLCRQLPPALLPVLNRPLVEHTIEDLAAAGVNEIFLVISDQAHKIEQTLGSGQRWGLSIRYLLSRGEESPDQIVSRFASLLTPPFLALRGDVYRSDTCIGLLAEAAETERKPLRAKIDGQDARMALVNRWPCTIDFLGWKVPPNPGAAAVTLIQGGFSPMQQAAELHAVNLQQLEYVSETPTGGMLASDDLLRAPHASIDSRSLINGRALVGQHAYIHPSARLLGNCVIGADCHVDRNAELVNSVVLPGTYIGEGLRVENAIVGPGQLIRIDRHAAVVINDPQLFLDMRYL